MNYSFIQPDYFYLAKKQFSRIGFALTLMAISAIGLQIGCSHLVNYFAGQGVKFFSTSWASWIFTFAPMYLAAMPLFLLTTKNMPRLRPAQFTFSAGAIAVFIIMCFPIMVAGSIMGNVLSFMLSFGASQNPLDSIAFSNNPLKIIIVAIIAPIFEEFIFRKTIIDRTIQYGEKNAIFFSALTFGLFHMNLFQFFYAFGLGLIFGYIYVRSGRIHYTIIMHMIINFLGSVVSPFILQYSGVYALVTSSQSNYMANYMEMLPRLSILFLYEIIYFGLAIAGFVLLIVKRRKFLIVPIRTQIYGARGLRAMYINAGFLLFAAVAFAMIARSLYF